jgi:transcription antitermination protein NusB
MSDPAETTPRKGRRRTDTSDPRASRARALKILFQADVRGVPAGQTLERLAGDPSARAILDDADVDALGEERERLDPVPGAAADAGPSGRTTAARQAAAGRVPAVDRFTTTLVNGVADHLAEIDELIERYARRWQISRMPVVDRTVLRLATFELLHESTPPPVVIDEAVTLAKTLSTDDSGRYVNGVLESIRKDIGARGPEATDT